MIKKIDKLKDIEKQIYLLGFENCLTEPSKIMESQEFKELKSQIKKVGGFSATFHKIEHYVSNKYYNDDRKFSVSQTELEGGQRGGALFLKDMAFTFSGKYIKSDDPRYDEYTKADNTFFEEGYITRKLAAGLHEILSNIIRVEDHFEFRAPQLDIDNPFNKGFQKLEIKLKKYQNHPNEYDWLTRNEGTEQVFGRLDKTTADRVEIMLKSMKEQLDAISKNKGVDVPYYRLSRPLTIAWSM